jgi:SAM-dependent methyltransferase
MRSTTAPLHLHHTTDSPGLERVERCDLCGDTELRFRASFPEYLLFTGETFTLVSCQGCGLHFINPRPVPEKIGAYYGEAYPAHERRAQVSAWQRAVGGPGERPSWLMRRYLELRQSVAWYRIPPFEGGGRALDIGCGGGALLDVLGGLGWETYGVEPDPKAVERAVERGHQVVCGPAEGEHFPDVEFDLVTMWHVLEHTHSPSTALRRVQRYLRPGGRFHLCVPNYRSFHSALFGKYWWSSDAPRHLYQFERRTLTRYLEQAGFEDIQITTRTGASSWLRGFRHTLNGWFGTRWSRDPAWLLALFEIPVVISSLFRFFGVGSELRVSCRKPG